jgi:CRISPR-associated protein Csm5
MTAAQLNTNYDITLEVLTPVHIGTDSNKLWMQGADFFVQDGKVYVVNQSALYQELMNIQARGNQSGLDHYMNLMTKGRFREIENYIKDEAIDLELIADNIFEYDGEIRNLATEIRPLVRTGTGVPIIPGSSIKGAIRSVLFNYLYGRLVHKPTGKKIDDLVLGRFSESVMRFIRPYDVEMPKTEVNNIELFNLYSSMSGWESNWKDKFKISAEIFSKQKATFRFNVADNLVKQIQAKSPQSLDKSVTTIFKNDNPIQFIFNLINEYTYQFLQKEIDFFEKYNQAEDTEFIIENLKNLQQQTVNNADSCVLRLAYGSGFHGITGDWRFDNHLDTVEKPEQVRKGRNTEQVRYKSRKVTGEDIDSTLMGFVKLYLPEGVPRIQFSKKAVIQPKTEKIEKEPSQQPNVNVPKGEKKVSSFKIKNFEELGKNAMIYAEVIELKRPFSKVRLLLENYPFDDIAMMSGSKKAQKQNVQVGDTVKVIVNSQTSDGKINTVKYM